MKTLDKFETHTLVHNEKLGMTFRVGTQSPNFSFYDMFLIYRTDLIFDVIILVTNRIEIENSGINCPRFDTFLAILRENNLLFTEIYP